MYVGGFAILFPLGVTRGVIGAVQVATESSGKQAFAHLAAVSSNATPAATMSADSKYLLESLTWGSGWQGQLLRLAASPFMPSTAQMMVRAQEAVEAKGSSEPQVIAAAASGFMEGILQDKKDTVTVLGLFGYSLIFCVGVGCDHIYGKANEKKRALQETYREKVSDARQKIERPLQQLKSIVLEEGEGSTKEALLEKAKANISKAMRKNPEKAKEALEAASDILEVAADFMAELDSKELDGKGGGDGLGKTIQEQSRVDSQDPVLEEGLPSKKTRVASVREAFASRRKMISEEIQGLRKQLEEPTSSQEYNSAREVGEMDEKSDRKKAGSNSDA